MANTYIRINGSLQGVYTVPNLILRYRKIPKISPGAYILQRPFLRGLFFFWGGGGGGGGGLMNGEKFAFQNGLG